MFICAAVATSCSLCACHCFYSIRIEEKQCSGGPRGVRLAPDPWSTAFYSQMTDLFKTVYSLERGSARFSWDGIHRTTRPWPHFCFIDQMCTNNRCKRGKAHNVSPVPLTRVWKTIDESVYNVIIVGSSRSDVNTHITCSVKEEGQELQ
jgi:hypothetical protein